MDFIWFYYFLFKQISVENKETTVMFHVLPTDSKKWGFSLAAVNTFLLKAGLFKKFSVTDDVEVKAVK